MPHIHSTYATVFNGIWKGIPVAIKKINPQARYKQHKVSHITDLISMKFSSSQDFEKEIHLMNSLRYVNQITDNLYVQDIQM